MKKLMIAVAMTTALPAAAFAQAKAGLSAAAPAAQAMKSMDCKDMHMKMSGSHSGHQMVAGSGQVDHSKMDHSKMDHSKMAATCGAMANSGASSASANPHANHKQ